MAPWDFRPRAAGTLARRAGLPGPASGAAGTLGPGGMTYARVIYEPRPLSGVNEAIAEVRGGTAKARLVLHP